MNKITFLILTILAPLMVLLGQDTNEEVIDLSPFVVSADSDIGYMSQQTLAGSRLRSNLGDVAAAISPMTLELIEDIGATNLLEASEYAINTRVETDDGRGAGPITDGYNNDFQDFRIRGLPGATRTLNYMPYIGGVDSFNTQRIEINRGPNSILYGIGSAAGVLNVSTKQAELGKSMSSIQFRVDSWDGYRGILDFNLPIVKDTLAIRAIYLHGEEESWRSFGHNDQDRFFLTAKWKIAKNTVLSAEYESLEQDRFNPRPHYGNDWTSYWVSNGMPMFDNFQGSAKPGNPTRDSSSTAVTGVREISGNPYIVLNGISDYAQNYRRFTRAEFPPGDRRSDFEHGISNPKAAIEANWVTSEWEDERYNLTLQHKLFDGFNAEIGLAHQRRTGFSTDSGGLMGGMQADPNLYFPDGELKDSQYVYHAEMRPSHRPNLDVLDYGRITLSYEKDIGKIGFLRIAGLGEFTKREVKREIYEQFLLKGPETTSGGAFHNNPENSRNRLYHRYYFGLEAFDDPSFLIPGPYDVSNGVLVKDPATGMETKYYAHLLNRSGGNVNWYEEENASMMIAGQFFTLNNRLVFTAGYRDDNLDRFQNQAVRDPAAAELGNVGAYIAVAPPDDPSSSFSGETYTYGAVFHVNDWFSVFYNYSNSILPPSTIRIAGGDPSNGDISNWIAPLKSGVTNDFGIKLSLLNDKIFITATRYETDAENDTGFSGFGSAREPVEDIWETLIDYDVLSDADRAMAQEQLTFVSGVQGYTFDSKTEGYEFELTGQISSNWTVTANFSITESIWSNVGLGFRRYLDYWKDPARGSLSWSDPDVLALDADQNPNVPGGEFADPYSFRSPADIYALNDYTADTDTVNEHVVDAEQGLYDKVHVYEGRQFIGNNKYNGNIRTRYDFKDGVLNGLRVGGGVRYREGRIAGNVIDYQLPSNVEDYSMAYNGRNVSGITEIEAVDQAIWDLVISYGRKLSDNVTWRIQLNVNNLFDEDEFIVNNAHPTTGEPLTYRYQDPRRFIITNTISF